LRGRKVAGLLCEARWQGESLAWVVTGIGVNVANAVPDVLAGSAATLREVASAAGPEALAGPLAAALAAAGGTGGPLDTAELTDFAARDFLHGRHLQAPVTGVATGVAPTGELLVRDDRGHEHRLLEARVELARGG